MKNIIKAEFHKLFHGISFYEYAILVLLLAFIQTLSEGRSYNNVDFYIIIIRATEYMIVAIMFTGIFLVYKWNKERKNGYIKNIAGNVSGRHVLTIAKFVTGSVVMVINSFITMLSFFVSYLVDCLIKGGRITFDAPISDMLTQIAAFLIWIVAGIAIVSLLLMFHELIRSAAFGYVLAIQFLPNLFEGIIAQLVYLIFKWDKLAEYLIIEGMKMMDTGVEMLDEAGEVMVFPNSMLGVLVRLCIYTVVFTTISVFVSRKRDV